MREGNSKAQEYETNINNASQLDTFLSSPVRTLVIDLGATSHFVRPNDITNDIQLASPGLRVEMPNADIITSREGLAPATKVAHIIPNLHHSLISLFFFGSNWLPYPITMIFTQKSDINDPFLFVSLSMY